MIIAHWPHVKWHAWHDGRRGLVISGEPIAGAINYKLGANLGALPQDVKELAVSILPNGRLSLRHAAMKLIRAKLCEVIKDVV